MRISWSGIMRLVRSSIRIRRSCPLVLAGFGLLRLKRGTRYIVTKEITAPARQL